MRTAAQIELYLSLSSKFTRRVKNTQLQSCFDEIPGKNTSLFADTIFCGHFDLLM